MSDFLSTSVSFQSNHQLLTAILRFAPLAENMSAALLDSPMIEICDSYDFSTFVAWILTGSINGKSRNCHAFLYYHPEAEIPPPPLKPEDAIPPPPPKPIPPP